MADFVNFNLFNQFSIEPHITGVGCFLYIPKDVEFKLTRQVAKEPEVRVAEGNYAWNKRWLDTGVSTSGPTTYRFYVYQSTDDNGNKLYTLDKTEIFQSKPQLSWGPMDDAAFFFASKPRDAIILFLSIRLAQLTKQGLIRLSKDKLERHTVRFPVQGHYEFNEVDMPVVAIDYTGGHGQAGDIGWQVSEDNLSLGIYIAADRIEDRNAVTDCVIGLMREIDWFLTDYGCSNITYGDFKHFIEDRNNVPIYMGQLSIGFTRFMFQFQNEEDLWQIVGNPEPVLITHVSGTDVYIIDNSDEWPL